ncbi:hypothetical protein ACLOJK_009398 [Asimina triloba]
MALLSSFYDFDKENLPPFAYAKRPKSLPTTKLSKPIFRHKRMRIPLADITYLFHRSLVSPSTCSGIGSDPDGSHSIRLPMLANASNPRKRKAPDGEASVAVQRPCDRASSLRKGFR